MVMVSTISAFDSLQGWRVLVLPNIIAIQSTSRLSFRKSQALRVKCDYSCFEARDVSYRPPGTELRLLNGVSFSLPEKSFGLIFGRSGSGKTTLLQLLAGLSNQPLVPFVFKSTVVMAILFGLLKFYRQKELALSSSFLRDNVLDEVTFGWPRQKGDYQLKEHLALRLQRAINWVGLNGMSLDKDPYSLSGGYKRRLALAIQLVQTPDLLILDDPLAGLDWKARADVVKLLKHLKKELIILVRAVSTS